MGRVSGQRHAKDGTLNELQSLKWRRTCGWTLGAILLAVAVYLRCFVFLRIGPGMLLVFLVFGMGAILIEDARRSNQRIKDFSLSSNAC